MIRRRCGEKNGPCRRGETAGWACGDLRRGMRVVAEKATRRESPLKSISHSGLPVSAYNTLYINMLRVAGAVMAGVIATAGLAASVQQAPDAFEVASIKVRTGEPGFTVG